MKKAFKTLVSGALACMLVNTITISAFAEGRLSMYHNIAGEPTDTTDTCWIYKNTGNSYYAQCTTLTNSTARVEGLNTTPDKVLSFTSTGRINFLATTYEDTLEFEGKMTIKNISNVAFANITIGS